MLPSWGINCRFHQFITVLSSLIEIEVNLLEGSCWIVPRKAKVVHCAKTLYNDPISPLSPYFHSSQKAVGRAICTIVFYLECLERKRQG